MNYAKFQFTAILAVLSSIGSNGFPDQGKWDFQFNAVTYFIFVDDAKYY